MRRTNWDPYLNMKCFVTICAKLFIGVSHINALHNWPTGRLFHAISTGLLSRLPAVFTFLLAFLDNQKGSRRPSRLAESWNCPCLLLPSVSGFVFLLLLFFFFFSIIFGSGARLYSYNLLILMSAAFPSGSESIEDSLWSVPWSQTLPPWFPMEFSLCCWFTKAVQSGMYVCSGGGRW